MRALIVLAAALACTVAAATPAAGTPRCFGAAARDPLHPCRNPALRYSIRPSPSLALITPNLACTPTEQIGRGTVAGGALSVCAFGTPAAQATATVGMVGDSHAMNWRAPVDVVARAHSWRVLGMMRSHCPFSQATILLAPADRRGCLRWRRRVIEWFAGHPEISVVFLAQYTSRRTPVAAQRGQSQFATQLDGYARAWRALPPTVAHIIVIRDNPWSTFGMPDCLRRAQARRLQPGPACAVPRSRVLLPDPAATAAIQLRSPRVEVADLTRFMCEPRVCLPVVGGALVNKDATHLTTAFATTLGPYLLRRVDHLMRGW